MNKNLTDITLVVDRSGSMAFCRSDADGGINQFIREQKEGPGEAVLTLVQFDNTYEPVYTARPIREVQSYSLRPGGSTALLDAVGRAINDTGRRLKEMPEESRPGLVIIAIVTDGQENASKEYTKGQIREMVQHQQNKYDWKFVFLSANLESFDEAMAWGIRASSMSTYNPGHTQVVYANLSQNVMRARTACVGGQSVEDINLSFTDEERKNMGSTEDVAS